MYFKYELIFLLLAERKQTLVAVSILNANSINCAIFMQFSQFIRLEVLDLCSKTFAVEHSKHVY